ncbi:hypothetical protein GPOL_c32900 [Gordonia polyisoprenivorans VH2]|uniref:ESAT-6-like protein n=3 Tax=Gordonia TaxID=2053 RepID=H6MY77_GORPV|nr:MULTISPECIES: hypothetical protein [Gordonia]AFA74304.1 hypothetical protein GPOL_c32900 [Gordonia polyisoprenivorans VH2]MBE7194869.1 hypothetical protein [Gordonia polyisoprenivorans]MDF3284284.1 hypothetical protein [Gordonia sp. N1V]NKY04056.1 hypothetical protein [Gordonia polyisoprenivorans]OPX14243.1 hypothetical protein B1964_16085 [Gordonia sp. i37]
MAQQITYNHGSIDTTLGDQASYLKAANEVRDDINAVFNSLLEIYEGEAATTLQHVKSQIDQQLIDAFNNMNDSTKHAGEQNQMMQALDAKNASLFS